MKFRYLIPAFVAVIAFFTGCKTDDDPIYLSNVSLSTSYVSLNTDGGTTAVELKASADWSIDEATVPEWLTVSPMSGSAGATTLNFSAAAATSTNQTTVKLNRGGQTQEINVLQYAEEADPEIITITEAVAMIKAGTQPASAVYFRGVVCRIQEISPQYGNATYFLSDDGTYGDGNWLEVYRGKWIDGENFTKGDEFSVGDEMVVKGVLIDYNGTPETQQGTAQVISVTKSLIKVDSLDVVELPIEGGFTTAALTCKGSGISVEIPADAQDWLSVAGINTQNATVKFKVQPNDGGDRNTTVTFKTVDGGKEYTATATISQKGAIVAATVGEFIAAEVGDAQYRLQGNITNLYYSKENLSGFYIRDYTGEVLVYKPEGFTGTEAKVGDVVTVMGKRTAYKDTPQMGSCVMESVDNVVEAISISDFKNLPDDTSKSKYYLISGTVRQTTAEEKEQGAKDDIEKYGNFYLVDESGNDVYIYGVINGWGGPKGKFGELGVSFGDKLTIIAYKTSYNGLIEGVGVYLSHEKAE